MTSTTTSSKTLEELPATGTNSAFAGVIRDVFEDPYQLDWSGALFGLAPGGNARSTPGDRKRKTQI